MSAHAASPSSVPRKASISDLASDTTPYRASITQMSNVASTSGGDGKDASLLDDGGDGSGSASQSAQQLLLPTTGFNGGTRLYAYYSLVIILLVYISNQIDRSVLGYVKVDVTRDLDISDGQYALLGGYAFSIVYVLSGMLMGRIADVWNRKWLLFCGLVLWSGVTAGSGVSQNFGELLANRIGLGIGQAACNPAALSMISDFFPPLQRPLASSIYSSGVYVGSGLSAAMGASTLEANVGWRWIYGMFGIFGFGLALIFAFTVHEPKRGQYKDAPTAEDSSSSSSSSKDSHDFTVQSGSGQAVGDVNGVADVEHFGGDGDGDGNAGEYAAADDVATYTLMETAQYIMHLNSAAITALAGGVRSLGGYAFGYFVPNYLQIKYNPSNDNYKDDPGERPNIGIYYGLMAAFGGALAAWIGGLVTSRWVQKNPKAPAYVCAIGACASVPFVASFLWVDHWRGSTDNTSFGLALASVFFAYLTAECWGGPAASIYQSILPSKMQGSGFALYFLVLTLIGGAGTEIVGAFPAAENSAAQPWVLFFTIGGSYVGAALLWWLAAQFSTSDLRAKAEFDRTRQHPAPSQHRIATFAFGVVGMLALAIALSVISLK